MVLYVVELKIPCFVFCFLFFVSGSGAGLGLGLGLGLVNTGTPCGHLRLSRIYRVEEVGFEADTSHQLMRGQIGNTVRRSEHDVIKYGLNRVISLASGRLFIVKTFSLSVPFRHGPGSVPSYVMV
jgi:hypothetical protein